MGGQEFLLAIGLLAIQLPSILSSSLEVHSSSSSVRARLGSNASLLCEASVEPLLCLWKTPYGHVYTLSAGVSAENGRIAHPRDSANSRRCALDITGVQMRDHGDWECEVGALIDDNFDTAKDAIALTLVQSPTTTRPTPIDSPKTTDSTTTTTKSTASSTSASSSVQQVGDEVLLNCVSATPQSRVSLCRWRTPYLNTYVVGRGIYVERGRIRWSGSNELFDCSILIKRLELRDAGEWVCEIGTHVNAAFNVQTKHFTIRIEAPLRLSAPTSLMHNGDTDATLVCHANKAFTSCSWKTPYGPTYVFDRKVREHEQGRIAFFSFTDTDCGIVVRNVEHRDNGQWICTLHARAIGQQWQNATDIVPLFTDTALASTPSSAPVQDTARAGSIPDYDDDERRSILEAFDLAHADFDKVNQNYHHLQNQQKKAPTTLELVPAATSRIQSFDEDLRGNKEIRFGPNAFEISTIPLVELSKLNNEKNETTNVFDPEELELLKRISGTRVDFRPVLLTNEEPQVDSGANESIGLKESILLADGASRPRILKEGDLQRMLNLSRRLKMEQKIKAQMMANIGRLHMESRARNILNKEHHQGRKETTETKTQEEARELREREEKRQRELEEKRQRERDEQRQRELEETRQRELEAKRHRELEAKRQRELDVKRLREREEKRQRELQERLQRELEAKRQRELEERRQAEVEAKRQRELEVKRQRELEEKRQKELEEKRQRELEEKRKKELEAKRQRELDERRQRELEARRQRELEAKRRRERLQEQRQKELEERRQKELEEKRKQELEERRQRELEEKREREIQRRRQREMEEKRRRELEIKRQRELEEKRRQDLEEKRQRELEDKRRRELEEKRRRELEDKRRRELEEKRRRELEEKRRRDLEEKRRRELEEKRRRDLEEKRRREIEEKRQKELEEKRRKELEEERQKELEEKRQKEREEKRQKELEEKRQKELEEKRQRELEAKRQRELEEKRRKELEERRQRELQKRREREREQKRQRDLEAKRAREEAEKRREEEESEKEPKSEISSREPSAGSSRGQEESRLQQKRRLFLERQRQQERQRRPEEKEISTSPSNEEELTLKQQEQRRREEQLRLSVSRIRQEQKHSFEDAQEERNSGRSINRSRIHLENRHTIRRQGKPRTESTTTTTSTSTTTTPTTTTRRSSTRKPASVAPVILKPKEELLEELLPDVKETIIGKDCTMSTAVDHGTVTCANSTATSDKSLRVSSGSACSLKCAPGFVSKDHSHSVCLLSGHFTRRFECVRPDALLLIGGRSDTYGVLNTAELVTSRGVCRGAVPPLPAMRWKMIAAAIDEDLIMTCGGVNMFGDPKRQCWTLSSSSSSWHSSSAMMTARDAAAWALEDHRLVVLGGRLGKLNGFTDSVEIFDTRTSQWTRGPSMSSSRYSHCAVGLGNGSIVVTGGYGGLQMTERLDLDTGQWTQLPELSPVRAQHGCSLATLFGAEGVLVVGGDSGGTRLKDVRFLPMNNPIWRKVAELKTARWGRPAVGVVGGRLAVAAGWDGQRDLDTVEIYDQYNEEWRITASRLQTERRWPAVTPISLKLFPKCVQRRHNGK